MFQVFKYDMEGYMATLFGGEVWTCIESNERGEPTAKVDEANVDTFTHVESSSQCFQALEAWEG